MNTEEIRTLIRAFDESNSVAMTIEQEGFRLKLKKGTAPVKESVPAERIPENIETAPAAEDSAAAGDLVRAPLVGVFYAAPSPEAEAYVQTGDRIQEGQTLCLIEAMKMMNEIKAPHSGVVKKVLVKNQDVVGFDDPLFLIGEA